jgi:hypothetical protein
MAMVFQVRVSHIEWDEVSSSWRCPALKIPGAHIDSMFVQGKLVDPGWYEVRSAEELIRWTRSDAPPESAAFSIRLTQDLSTKKETSRYKGSTGILGALVAAAAAIIVALIQRPPARQAPTTATIKGMVKVDGQPVAPQEVNLSVTPPSQKLLQDGTFEITRVPVSLDTKDSTPSLVVSLPGYATQTVHLEERPDYGVTDYHVRVSNGLFSISDPIVLHKAQPYSSTP